MVKPPKVVVAPTVEPVSIERARRHLQLVPTGDPAAHFEDAWIVDHLVDCRQWCEQYTERSLAPQTLELGLDAWPSCMLALPMGPAVSIVSISYVDQNGLAQTLDPAVYELDDFADLPQLLLAYGQAWPAARSAVNAVRVRYRAGYAAPGDMEALEAGHPQVPGPIIAAIQLILGHLHENRETNVTSVTVAELPLGVQALLSPYRTGLGV